MYGMMVQKSMPQRLDISVDYRHASDIYNTLIANWYKLHETRFFWNDEATMLRIVAENNDVFTVCKILDDLQQQ